MLSFVARQSSSPEVEMTFRADEACTKTCSQDCLNGGSCVAKDACSCLPGFSGPFCGYKMCFVIPIENGHFEERLVKNI